MSTDTTSTTPQPQSAGLTAKKVAAIALVILIFTAGFAFWYGENYQAGISNPEIKRLKTQNQTLVDSIKVQDTVIRYVNAKYAQTLTALKQKKVQYVTINQKYDKMDSLVKSMPTNEQVQFLASWLSKSDTVTQR